MKSKILATFDQTNPADKGISSELGWFVISPHWFKDKVTRRKLHGKWFRIQDQDTGKVIYRIIRFSPRFKKSSEGDRGEVLFDWPAQFVLNNYEGVEKSTYRLKIRKANWLQQLLAAWIHPDPSQRLFFRIGLILGVLSVVLGLISLVLSLS